MSQLASLGLLGFFGGLLAVGCAAGGGESVPDGAAAADLLVEPSRRTCVKVNLAKAIWQTMART